MTLLLIALLVCHYLADYCLTLPVMIRAKADGKTYWPIVLHSIVHAALVGVCLLLWSVSWSQMLMLMALEMVSHFIIDTAKGRLSASFPVLADVQRKLYWMLYGFDQLLHQMVIALIWFNAFR